MKAICLWFTKSSIIISAIVYGFSMIDQITLLRTINSLNLTFLVVFFLVSFIHRVINSWRLCYISDLVDVSGKLNLLYSFRIFIFAELVSVILPTSYSGEVARILKLKKLNIGIKSASVIVIFDRLSGVLCLTIISLLSLALFQNKISESMSFGSEYLLVLLIVVSLLVAYLLRNNFLNAINRLSIKGHGLLLGKIMLLSVVITIFALLSFVLAFQSANVQIEAISVIAVLFLSYLSKIAPISLAGIGASEITFVALCVFFGVDKESALVVALIIVSAKYLFSVLSGIIELSCDGANMFKQTLMRSMDKN